MLLRPCRLDQQQTRRRLLKRQATLLRRITLRRTSRASSLKRTGGGTPASGDDYNAPSPPLPQRPQFSPAHEDEEEESPQLPRRPPSQAFSHASPPPAMRPLQIDTPRTRQLSVSRADD
ncbi:hypothetical protein MRB53_039936 [Persea americana]|nr:hypothetical protein MRB53_039936 [Persea americana]